VSDTGETTLSLSDVLAAFLGGGPLDYSEVEEAALSAGCSPVDDLAPVEKLMPRSRIPVEDIAAWATEFSNAPFLTLSRASTPHPEDPDGMIIFRIRRVWISEVDEQDLYEWTTNFCGYDAAGKKEESGGHHSWIWAWNSDDRRVLQDGFRLYVAGPDNCMILERISAAIL
jgi:hypothetical protein